MFFNSNLKLLIKYIAGLIYGLLNRSISAPHLYADVVLETSAAADVAQGQLDLQVVRVLGHETQGLVHEAESVVEWLGNLLAPAEQGRPSQPSVQDLHLPHVLWKQENHVNFDRKRPGSTSAPTQLAYKDFGVRF